MEDTIRVHAKHGLTREVFVGVLDPVNFMDGAQDVFATLHAAGVHSALITGGFKYQADRAAKELRIKHVFAGCEYYWDDDGSLLHWTLLPADYDGKVDFMRLLSADYGYTKADIAFVGDGENDIALAREVGISIAFNGPRKLCEACTYEVKQEHGKQNLRQILPLLGFSHDQ
jgi:phosphoserine phosphatase